MFLLQCLIAHQFGKQQKKNKNCKVALTLARQLCLLAFHVATPLPQSVCCGFTSERGQHIHSIAILTLFFKIFFSASGVGLVGAELKSPRNTPVVMGALPRPHSCLVWVAFNWGDTQWRVRLKMVMLPVDSPRTQPYSQGHAFQQSL